MVVKTSNIDELDLALISAVYMEILTKDKLAQTLKVSTKTIENRAKKLNEIIKYSKKLGGYIFVDLLPKAISPQVVISNIFDEIESIKARDFYSDILINYFFNCINFLIDTEKIPNLFQKIIMIKHAINHKIKLEIIYKEQKREIILVNMGVFNNERIALSSTKEILYINDIKNICIKEYTNHNYNAEKYFNAFGTLDTKKEVVVCFQSENYFLREQPKSYFYEFLYEDDIGRFYKMYLADDELLYFKNIFSKNIKELKYV